MTGQEPHPTAVAELRRGTTGCGSSGQATEAELPPRPTRPHWVSEERGRPSGDVDSEASAQQQTDLQLAEAGRGVKLLATDARKLAEVRRWFEAHAAPPGLAPYCVGMDGGEPYEDWYTGSSGSTACPGHYDAQDERGRLDLYEHVLACFEIGVPLVLLARQPPLYALFFDLDLYGAREDTTGGDEVHRVAWEAEGKALSKAIVSVVLEVYAQYRGGLELAVLGSSGFCRQRRRYKASYHYVFPQIIVDRPVKCWPEGGTQCDRPGPARHAAVRHHVVCRLTEEAQAEGSALGRVRQELLRCCSWEAVGADEGEDVTYLNDWTEVLDENPLWHEPWPEACTGFRLPFTDKPHEGRPKRPMGRWSCSAEIPGECRMEPLPDLDPVEWVRLGDVSACTAREPTPWDEAAIHEAVWAECRCPDCAAGSRA